MRLNQAVFQTARIKMNTAIQDYTKHLDDIGRSLETVRTYENNLNRFHRYLGSKYNCQVYVNDVTAADFEEYLKDEQSDCSSAYRFNMITAFKCFFSFCYKKGYVSTNIAKQVKQVRRRVKERSYLTPVEFDMLAETIDVKIINATVQVLYYAGLRINELQKLTLDDVDFEKNCITVNKDKEKHTRIIPINYKLRAVLLDYLDNYRCDKDTDLFFVSRSGSISPNYINLVLRDASQKAGINKPVTCHIMRHSFASNLVAKGCDLNRLQKLLGHTDIKTTSIYLHTNMDELRKATNLLK
jgi:integrase/recombinase XerD